ncbi:adenine deaminase [Apilactobacillus timberlakei]|uniref:Adenine deaminase n=1 Tax=Apilactobacillus timberlakei TaxID=2008380 RepID=A0ABY2YRF8_9LACO|nr:adenine deaminase [Apilactobacillus timberlakei]TPR12333.1 adenine deaminase [Apilactobacillus timberlakei]TPR14391.1 adenine deaminase [Apilactobacillus timberlakei]
MHTIDLIIKNGQVLNVYKKQFELKDLYINDGKIIEEQENQYQAKQIIDAKNQYLVPGFIDSHVHIESSLVTPSELGKVIVPMGVTSVVTDPHEIANVSGIEGIKYMINDAKQSPLDVFVMLPSSVPATSFEHNGATLNADSLHPLYKDSSVIGLAEVMDYPAVHNRNQDMMNKINDSLNHGYQVDGHGAGLSAKQLGEYKEVGISTDHESTTLNQMYDRLDVGMNMFLREGTVERDLQNTIQAVNKDNIDQFSFCTDDKFITTIINEGSINFNIQLAIEYGIKPEDAYVMASLNAAKAHKINNLGALTPGYKADIVMVSDPKKVDVKQVIKNGKLMTENNFNSTPLKFTKNTVHQNIKLEDLTLPLESNQECHVIGIQPNHIETDHLKMNVPVEDGLFKADLENDVLKMVDVERHHNLGTFGIGLVNGFNIKNGAVATTVAHDSHNIVAVGTSDENIYRAIQSITKVGGGIAVVNDNQNVTVMPLPVAGLMSDKSWQIASEDLNAITKAFKQISGDINFNPFITLSFLTLPVIPTIKLTDQGVYDFNQQKFIDIQSK